MNKLLTKVARLALGLSLAAGVGVAVGSKKASRVDATPEGTYSLVIEYGDFTTSSYANNNGDHSKNASRTSGSGDSTMSVTYNSYQVYQQTNKMQWQKNKGLIYNKTDLGTITSISIADGSNLTYTIGSSENPSSSASGGYFAVKVGSSTGYCTSITINFTISSSSGPSQLAAPNPTYNSADNEVTWSAIANASSYKVSVDNETSYATATSPYDVSGLTVGVSHTVYVKAIGDGTNYTDSTAGSVTFTPAAPFVGKEYELVTSASGLSAGSNYIFTNGTSGSVKTMATASNSNNRKATSVSVDNVTNKITSTSTTLVLELGGSSDAWTFQTTNYLGTDGYLASAASGNYNYLRVIPDANTATIDFNNDAVVINIGPHESRTEIRFNPDGDNNNGIFACYSTGQDPIYLWKEVVVSNDTTTVLSVSPTSWTGYDTDTISLSNYTVSCTTSASDDGYVFQGIGSGSDANFAGRDSDKSSFVPKTTDTRLQWKAKYPTTAGGSTFLYASVALTVTADTVSSVSASINSGTYYAGSKLVASNFAVSAVYSHAGSKSVTEGFTWTINDVADGELSGGDNTVVVTYGGVSSASFVVSASYAKGTHQTNPYGVAELIAAQSTWINQNVYVQGYISDWYNTYAYITDTKEATTDNSERIEVWISSINFVEGTADQYVTGTKVVVYGKLSYFSSQKLYEMANLVGQSSGDVYIKEVEPLSSISIKTQPSKTTYNVGDYFDPTGLEITLHYESREVDVTYSNETSANFSFSPTTSTQLQSGDTAVQVTYGGKSANIPIVIDSAVHTTAIVLKMGQNEAPATLERALNAGDITLTAALTPSNSEDEIVWTSSDDNKAVVIDGEVTFGVETGVVTISATSGGHSDSIEITLTDPTDAYLYSIAIVEGSGVVKDYYNDTNLDTTGLSVTATFKSNDVTGWSKDVENYTNNISYELDRENGMVIAKYGDGQSIYDIMEVNIHNSNKPSSFNIEFAPTTTSTNMTGENDAELFGLDADEWNIYSTKNSSASNQIGLNKAGYLALYYYNGGDGNELHIEAKSGSPYYIVSIKLSIKQNADHKVYKLNPSATEVTGTNDTYSINATSCYIKNTKTSNTQLHLYYVEVTWGYVDSFVAAQTFETNFIKRGVDYPQSAPTGVDGTNCLSTSKGGLGYFDTAVSEYNSLADSQSRVWFATRAEFANARVRFQAWAVANGKTLAFNADGSINVTSGARLMPIFGNETSSNTIAIIVIISLVSVTAIGGYFFLRKRREQN